MYVSSFAISGYRSLKNIEIKGMLPICILHGLNNSGKSNILSALETIFRRKLLLEDTTTPNDVKTHTREGSFYQGRITGFIHNFYLNRKDDITFSVSVTFADDELKFMKDVLKDFRASLAQPGHSKVLTLEGKIKYVDENSAEMVLEKAVFNKKHIVFEVDKDGKRSFFPKNPTLSADKKLSYFEELMNLLADSFRVLPSHRYLTNEKVGQEPGSYPAPENFKRWMFGQSLSRAGYNMYEEIKDMFAKEPFSIGEIGFS